MWIFFSVDLILFSNVPLYSKFKLGAEIVNTAFLLQEYQDKDTGKANVQDRMFL